MKGGKHEQGQSDQRAARLKAALRANLSRRKAQARARADDAEPDQNNSGETGQDTRDEQ